MCAENSSGSATMGHASLGTGDHRNACKQAQKLISDCDMHCKRKK